MRENRTYGLMREGRPNGLFSTLPFSVEKKYLDKSIAGVYHFGIQKVQYKKGREIANGKNGNDTRKTYAGNKRKG